MKIYSAAAVLAGAIALMGCNKASDKSAADQTADTNLTSVNRIQGNSDGTGASVNVRVDTGEIKENLREAAGATRDAFKRAGEKIDTAATDFKERVSRSLRDDPKYSTSSQGVEINSDKGKVTLTGSVKTDQEKRDLEARIRELTGASEVDNQIRVSAEIK